MKVLFVSHDASRTGAPILFLNLIRWFKENTPIPFEILLKSGGELEPVFAGLGKCTVYNGSEFEPGKPSGLFGRLGWKRREQLVDRYRNAGISLIYANTLTNGEIYHRLAGLDCKIITHAHELENYIHSCGRDNLDKIIRYTDHYIAPSWAVKENLVLNHGIEANKIDVVYEFLGDGIIDGSKITMAREEVLSALSIPADAFVVGACGTADWRKSPDLFVQLAGYAKRHYPERLLYFLWVGGVMSWELEYDAKKLGLENIRFVPHTERFVDYINCMDVFVLTSRVDPCPLVCLEAASLGKPVICFAGAGGMPEFVEEDAGFVVPFLGLESMAEKVMTLFRDRDLLAKLGSRGRIKVKERHEADVAGKEILAIIKRVMADE